MPEEDNAHFKTALDTLTIEVSQSTEEGEERRYFQRVGENEGGQESRFLDTMDKLVAGMDTRMQRMEACMSAGFAGIQAVLLTIARQRQAEEPTTTTTPQALTQQLPALAATLQLAAQPLATGDLPQVQDNPAAQRPQPRLSGRVLDDFPMRAVTQEQIRELWVQCHQKPDITARELFKFPVGWERYQSYTNTMNWEGLDNKAALPLCLRGRILAVIDTEFVDVHLPKVHTRINKFLRMPRKSEWQSLLDKPRRSLLPESPDQWPQRPFPGTPAMDSRRHIDFGCTMQEQSGPLPPVASFVHTPHDGYKHPLTSTPMLSRMVRALTSSSLASGTSPTPFYASL